MAVSQASMRSPKPSCNTLVLVPYFLGRAATYIIYLSPLKSKLGIASGDRRLCKWRRDLYPLSGQHTVPLAYELSVKSVPSGPDGMLGYRFLLELILSDLHEQPISDFIVTVLLTRGGLTRGRVEKLKTQPKPALGEV